jgi:hypothetical protein
MHKNQTVHYKKIKKTKTKPLKRPKGQKYFARVENGGSEVFHKKPN